MSSMERVKLKICLELDEEAGVWYVSESDIPGLATEAATVDELMRKLPVMVQELIELNGLPDREGKVPIELLIHSEQRIALGC